MDKLCVWTSLKLRGWFPWIIPPRTIREFCLSDRYSDLHFSSSVLFCAAVNGDCNLHTATHRRRIEIEIYKQRMNEVVSKLTITFVRLYCMYWLVTGKKEKNSSLKFEKETLITISNNTAPFPDSITHIYIRNWISLKTKRKRDEILAQNLFKDNVLPKHMERRCMNYQN